MRNQRFNVFRHLLSTGYKGVALLLGQAYVSGYAQLSRNEFSSACVMVLTGDGLS